MAVSDGGGPSDATKMLHYGAYGASPEEVAFRHREKVARLEAENRRLTSETSAKWLSPDDQIWTDEFVVKLTPDVRHHSAMASFWWGKSVHQIATMDDEGDIWCRGQKIARDAIVGWMPLPNEQP